MAQQMPLPFTLLLQEIQIGFGFAFLVLAHPGSPGQNPEICKMILVVVVVAVAVVVVTKLVFLLRYWLLLHYPCHNVLCYCSAYRWHHTAHGKKKLYLS